MPALLYSLMLLCNFSQGWSRMTTEGENDRWNTDATSAHMI